MAFTEKIIYYFDSPGPHNTADAARIAVSRAKELGLSTGSGGKYIRGDCVEIL